MQKHILSYLLFTITVATYTAENPTPDKNKHDIQHHIISRGYPQKNYSQKSSAEVVQGIVMDNKEASLTQNNSLKNLEKSSLFVIDRPSKL